MPEPRSRASGAYTLSVVGIWIALAVVRLLSHEMWRDELQAWMIARSSQTPLELISNLRYEGHPGLWPFFLFLVSRLTDSPVGMQMLNLATGAATVGILVRYAPFSRWVTLCLAFGYYLAYQYGTLSRSYSLGVLLVVAFCALSASTLRRRSTWMAVTLAALALTSIYGVIVAIGLGAGVAWETWSNLPHPARRLRRIAPLATIVAVGIAVTLVSMRQPSDAGYNPRLRLAPEASGALLAMGSVWRGLAPVPPITTSFWNHDILEPFPLVRGAAGAALFACALLVLRGNRGALVTFLVGGGGLFIFTYVVYTGGIRHHGHYLLLFLAASWMAATRAAPPHLARAWAGLLVPLALVQLVAATYASAVDFRATFSGSRDAAAYIRAHYPADIPIVVEPELPGVPVAAWLKRDVFFAQSDRLGGFVVWNNRQKPSNFDHAVEAADRLCAASQRDVLLVTANNRPVPPARFRHVGHFEGAIVPEETYEVYLLTARQTHP